MLVTVRRYLYRTHIMNNLRIIHIFFMNILMVCYEHLKFNEYSMNIYTILSKNILLIRSNQFTIIIQ